MEKARKKYQVLQLLFLLDKWTGILHVVGAEISAKSGGALSQGAGNESLNFSTLRLVHISLALF